MTDLPARRLARNARWVWRLYIAGFGLAVLLGAAIAVSPPGWVLLLALVVIVAAVAVAPELRWRAWRWDVRPEAIEIRRGVLRIRHTVVPMVRVQHVDTTSDLLAQWFSLATVEIHTAADSHKIPLLDAGAAEEVRARIAALSDEP